VIGSHSTHVDDDVDDAAAKHSECLLPWATDGTAANDACQCRTDEGPDGIRGKGHNRLAAPQSQGTLAICCRGRRGGVGEQEQLHR